MCELPSSPAKSGCSSHCQLSIRISSSLLPNSMHGEESKTVIGEKSVT